MSRNQKIILIVLLIAGITLWHYTTDVHHPFLHILHRELYLIPIGFAAYWFGARGGLTAAAISIICFLPKIFMYGHDATTYNINNALEIPTFIFVGYLIGKYRDVQKNQFMPHWKHQEEKPEKGSYNILLCIDNSENAYKAAQYAADTFSKNEQASITIMGFVREPSGDLFSDQEEQNKAKADIEANITGLVKDAQEALQKRSFSPEAVHTKVLTVQKESIADKILEEQKSGRYDTIVVGGSKMSKTEEFLLGNIAVKLVRKANCPVITVF